MGNTIAYADVTNYPCIADIYGLYDEVDVYVADFIKYFSNDLYSEFEHKLPTRATLLKASALSVFTHTITHEVHHKGQIISISRNLGYTPPDTDFIRF